MLSVPVTESADNSHTGASVAHWWGVCCTCKVINGDRLRSKKRRYIFSKRRILNNWTLLKQVHTIFTAPHCRAEAINACAFVSFKPLFLRIVPSLNLFFNKEEEEEKEEREMNHHFGRV